MLPFLMGKDQDGGIGTSTPPPATTTTPAQQAAASTIPNDLWGQQFTLYSEGKGPAPTAAKTAADNAYLNPLGQSWEPTTASTGASTANGGVGPAAGATTGMGKNAYTAYTPAQEAQLTQQALSEGFIDQATGQPVVPLGESYGGDLGYSAAGTQAIDNSDNFGKLTSSTNDNLLEPETGFNGFIAQLIPAIEAGIVTAGVGSAAAAGLAELGAGTLGSAAGGAAIGSAAGSTASQLTTTGNVSASKVGSSALLAGVSAGLANEAQPLTSGLSDYLGTTASTAITKGLTGAATSALGAELTGKDVGTSAELGGLSGGVSGAVAGSGVLSGTGVFGGLAAGALTGLVTSTLTSSSGSGASYKGSSESTLSPGVSPLPSSGASNVDGSSLGTIENPTLTSPTQTSPTSSSSSGSSFLGDVGTGLANTLGGTGSSLGTDLGTLLPYAGVAAIGEAQAAAGQKQDAAASQTQQALAQPSITESNSLLGQYNSGTLNAADAAVVNTGIAQGQSVIASANGLSAIAQQAFAQYNSGQLKPADQAALDAQTASQKQQVAQQLASAGITDSTILAAQNQQIDNNALISKQNTLNGYLSTGNAEYDQWLSATTQGQQTITQAQTYASTSLNNYLSASMSEAGIGIGEMNTAIQTQMTTDEKYAAQVSTLLGTLATAYAKQTAQTSANNKNGNTAGSTAANAAKTAAGSSGTGGTGSSSDPNNPAAIGSDIDNTDTSDPFAVNADGQYDISTLTNGDGLDGVDSGANFGNVDTSLTDDLSGITGGVDSSFFDSEINP